MEAELAGVYSGLHGEEFWHYLLRGSASHTKCQHQGEEESAQR